MANTNEQAIRELTDSWKKAVEAKDVDAILANYSDDVIVFDVPPPLQDRGRQAYRKHWEDWLKNFRGAIKCEFRDMQITAGDDVAFLSTLTSIEEKDEKGSGSWVRVTVGYRKINGKWLATHEHASIPAGSQQ